ncbi:hypothetical protein BpHYR1_007614 [Brachionus plicatilis]|uniref:Uncharacterized protein n=1 Tax=Brachionus plicatilis TaxID=10195 RepID=A0A3M7QTN0_BRAPC|nr:hypothetical protein BpHYR1_007614 [Brachionus plicatilis]
MCNMSFSSDMIKVSIIVMSRFRVIRKAVYWPQGVSKKEIYKKYNIRTIQDRATFLANKYIGRIYELNIIIKELIDEYKTAKTFYEGTYCRIARGLTI